MNSRILATVFRAEIGRSANDPAILKILLLSPAAILASLWPYIGSPFVPAFLISFAALEPQFNNILFRTPREFEAMLVLPTEWKSVIAAKNFASIVASGTLAIGASAVLGYFSPLPMGPEGWRGAGLCFISLIFPLLMVGNLHSIQHPRRHAGFTPGDLAEAILMLLGAGVCSIPYFVLHELEHGTVMIVMYSLLAAALWWRLSIRRMSDTIASERIRICQTE
jgi:hypothetical protein